MRHCYGLILTSNNIALKQQHKINELLANNMKLEKKAEFDRPGERSPEQDCCC